MNCENYLSEFGSNYSQNNSNDLVLKSPIIYESIISEDSNNDDSYNSIDYIDQSINLDINQFEHKIRRLSAENKTLNQSLIRLEEQIIDLINDKQNLEKSLKSQNDYFKNKIYLFESNVQELNHNIESLENTNFKLEEKLNHKTKEKAKLELRLEEIKDKV
jgi:chromosome segregation ATPase